MQMLAVCDETGNRIRRHTYRGRYGDCGNYALSVLNHPTEKCGSGSCRGWGIRCNERRFGWSAWAVHGNQGWTVLRAQAVAEPLGGLPS